MSRPVLSLIAAVARNGAIGRDGRLLMHLPGDLPRFKRLTAGHPVVMGRKTWESVGRPLPGRRNIVLSRDPAWRAEGAERVGSLADALALGHAAPRVFVIGGATVYAEALPLADVLELTEIDADLDGDTYFPAWDRADFACVGEEPRVTGEGVAFRHTTYRRRTEGA